jgi:hypothetical protein
MDKNKLGELYSLATQRMHDLIDELYENLHNESGEPKDTEAQVTLETSKIIRAVRSELDLIKTSALEYYESNSR